MRDVALTLALALSLVACGKHAARGAGQGATIGAASGAVGGMVSALVFGGNIAEGAARGAVYGGAVGATAGAISGSQADAQQARQREDELAKLREDIGPDAYDGLAALAECRHGEALAQADKAQRSSNPDYALAGLWLAVLTYGDNKQESQARSLFPTLIEKDDQLNSDVEAEETMRTALAKLVTVREEYGLKPVCA